jgi:hypothetical protein
MGPAELELIAPMIFAVILTLTVGGVILLKPIYGSPPERS